MDSATGVKETLSERLGVLEKMLAGCIELLNVEPTGSPAREVTATYTKIMEMQDTVTTMSDMAQAIRRSLSEL